MAVGARGRGVPEPPATPSARSLPRAVATAAVLVAALAASAALGPPYLLAFVAAVVLVALLELLDALRAGGHFVSPVFGAGCALGLMVSSYLGSPGAMAVVAGVTVAGAFALALRPGRGDHGSTGAAWTVMAVAWIGGGGAAAAAILTLDGGVGLLLALVAAVAAGDIAAFFAGSRLGRRKLAPSISPGKTWEGAAAGAVAAVAAGWAAGAAVGALGPVPGVLLGLVCGVVAPLGDLAESLVKREVGIKDSSKLLPGHGGFLDRLDAMLLCAPAAYAYLVLFP